MLSEATPLKKGCTVFGNDGVFASNVAPKRRIVFTKEWLCPKCGLINRAWRTSCVKCGEARPDG